MMSPPPSLGTSLSLKLSLPNLESPLHVMGKVAWRRTEYEASRPIGVGVTFHNLSDEKKEALRQYIDAVLRHKI